MPLSINSKSFSRSSSPRSAEIQTQMDASTGALETVAVKPKKTNITVRLFTLAWAPTEKTQPAN